MTDRKLVFAGAINMFIAVGAGAFGSHGLKKMLTPDMLAIWQTAVTYQMVHALGLLLIGLLLRNGFAPMLKLAGWLMLAGIVLFSGSLYVLAFTGVRVLGAITPIGGLGFLAGWALLAWAALKR